MWMWWLKIKRWLLKGKHNSNYKSQCKHVSPKLPGKVMRYIQAGSWWCFYKLRGTSSFSSLSCPCHSPGWIALYAADATPRIGSAGTLTREGPSPNPAPSSCLNVLVLQWSARSGPNWWCFAPWAAWLRGGGSSLLQGSRRPSRAAAPPVWKRRLKEVNLQKTTVVNMTSWVDGVKS